MSSFSDHFVEFTALAFVYSCYIGDFGTYSHLYTPDMRDTIASWLTVKRSCLKELGLGLVTGKTECSLPRHAASRFSSYQIKPITKM